MCPWPWLVFGASAQDLTFDAVSRVAVGASPSITFHAQVDGAVHAELTCSGTAFALDRKLAAGASATLTLSGLREGAHPCAGKVRLDQPSGDWAEAPLSLTVEVRSPIGFTFSAADVDLPGHKLVVHPSRPVAKAELELRGAGGAVLGRETATLTDKAHPTFSWVTEDEVIVLAVTVTDDAGIAATLELSPWSYAIPHDDVVFASGSDAITASEEPKLERCWADVERVMAKYGSVVKIQLFVAGYTDTVGDEAMNQALSERRARSIARWFVRRGFPGEVWAQGFGEDVLAVATPDETDAAPNRRALYLLAAQQPPISPTLPRDRWGRP